MKVIQSIHYLKPLNDGGSIARAGFEFQDHVAVSFCLEMASNPSLHEVWCETQDDITLIWREINHEWVEFVQVKSTEFPHFWSISELCKREKNSQGNAKINSSILEKSLTQDRCKEACRFRIVTTLAINNDLDILKYPIDSPLRSGTTRLNCLDYLITEIRQRLPGIISENNHDISDWVNNTVWQVEHSLEAVKNKNIPRLAKLVEKLGWRLPIELIEHRVYPELLQKVKEAGLAEWAIRPKSKKIRRNDFNEWLKILVDEVAHSTFVAGEKIQEKMEKAKIPTDYIVSALDERRKYRQESLQPQYLEVSDKELIEGEILVTLQQLRMDLDLGKYEPGASFYGVCLSKLRELQSSVKTKALPPLFYLTGCMHDITDRCGHRYHREKI
jgi:hypothetical protein